MLTHVSERGSSNVVNNTQFVSANWAITGSVSGSSPVLHSCITLNNPDNKVYGANMGPTWVLLAPDGPHVGPMNLAIREHRHIALMEHEKETVLKF